MATIMEMPKLSDTMREGAIARWLKKEGEKVSAGLPVVEIETDKATMEYESPGSGTLLKIIVGDGQTCDLQAPIAVIGKPDEDWKDALEKHGAKKKGGAAPAKAAPPTAPKQPAQAAPAPAAQPAPQASAKPAQSAPAPQPQTAAQPSGDGDRVKVSPLARRVAADKGLDLRQLNGSGPQGRIVLRDVESAQATTRPQSSAGPLAAAPAEMEKVPLSMMRKTIARRLAESVQQSPHFFLTISINMGSLLTWRKQASAKLPEDQKFSVNDLIVFLVARALRKHPAVNASWQGEFIAQYNTVHMGIAVALPNGLVTPVVRNADKLNLVQIAQRSRELIKLARDGKLQPDDYAGGTFTISNLGMNGIEDFTAIINPPQAAILAVGATIATPVVNDKGEIVVENRMKVTLSCDHRVIDGAVGSEFLKTLKQCMEDPVSTLFFG